MPAPYDYSSASGYSRTRADWAAWPSTTTPITQANLDKLDQAVFDLKLAVYNVKDYGAVGDGAATDTTAIANAYAAIPATGGVLLFPPGTYKGVLVMNVNKHVRVSGYGATLKPPASTIGITVSQGNGMLGIGGSTIEGLLIDGTNKTTGATAGIKIVDSDFIKVRDVKIQFCGTGIHLNPSGAAWVEAFNLTSSAIYECLTGINFDPQGAGASFAETVLMDVGINACDVSINADSNNGAGLERSLFSGVTIWLARVGDIGVIIGCQVVNARWFVNFESTLANTCFDVRTGATYMDNAFIQADMNVGGATTKATVAAGLFISWHEGSNYIFTVLGAGAAEPLPFRLRRVGDTDDRLAISGGVTPKIVFGPGNAAADVNLYRAAANVLRTDDDFSVGASSLIYMDIAGNFFLAEIAEPANSPANTVKLFAKDNGSGKTQLCARFATGATIVITTEP